ASRAKAALSAGVMSSAGLPVHMQRSIHVPDHIVKRCVRLYTRHTEVSMTLRLRYRVWKLTAASLLLAGTGVAAQPSIVQPSIVDGIAVTCAIANIVTAYCPNLEADPEYMQRVDVIKKALVTPDDEHLFLTAIGRHAVNLRRKLDELGEAEFCADALIAFGPPPGDGTLILGPDHAGDIAHWPTYEP
ncbi:MAG: hypothetical protein WBD78_11185, partial [Methylocella sp.]